VDEQTEEAGAEETRMDFGDILIVSLFSKPDWDDLEKQNVIMRSILLIICFMLRFGSRSLFHKCSKYFETK
jgi:hypothetical protein